MSTNDTLRGVVLPERFPPESTPEPGWDKGYEDGYNQALDDVAALNDGAVAERTKQLEASVREFAGFFSSDDPKHWQLHGLADGVDYDSAKEGV